MHLVPTHFARISKITTCQTRNVCKCKNNDNVRITNVVPFELYIQTLLKTTGRFLACVIDFHVFFAKFNTVKCDFNAFASEKYKKKKLIIFQFSFCNLHCPKSFRYAFI